VRAVGKSPREPSGADTTSFRVRGYPFEVPTDLPGLLDRARGTLDVLVREMLKFGMVGAVAFVIDLGGYNVLVFGPHLLGMIGEGNTVGALHDKPLTAKLLSATAATFVAWLGNRLWTFRHRRQRQAAHELALFVLFNVAAMVIAAVCLGFSRYVLDLHSQLSDNVTNIVGIGIGTLFRFWAYRKYVFAGNLAEGPLEPANKS
jgi:putative flippase GtrA